MPLQNSNSLTSRFFSKGKLIEMTHSKITDILPKNNRRSFLKQTGSLLIGFNLLPLSFCSSNPVQDFLTEDLPFEVDRNLVDAWIRIDADGSVTVLTGKLELGQGIKTALMQIAAEELDVDMSRVDIIIADTGRTANERVTAGSGSIEGSGTAIRNAAAEARSILMKLAAEELKLSTSELTVEDGVVSGRRGDNTVAYWDLLKGKKIEGRVTGNAQKKNPTDYKIVGTGYKREDIKSMVTGGENYVQDLRFPDMLHARIVRPVNYLSKLVNLPKAEALKMEGVEDVIVDGSFVGVICQEEFQAIKAMNFLKENSEWNSPKISPLADELYSDMMANSNQPNLVEDSGPIERNLSEAYAIEAEYFRPFHMHASIGPSCAVALWKNDQLTIWTHSQGVYPLRSTVASMLNLPEEKIRAIGVPGSGCYGHNGADDVAADAALLAMKKPGKPIRLQWMREEEHAWEPYGSAMIMRMNGAVKDGEITAWHAKLWSDTHSTRPGGRPGNIISARYLEKPFELRAGGYSGGSYRNASPLYSVNALRIEMYDYTSPLRTSALRGLGAYANIFALESFMDELAHNAGIDPVDFRLQNLTDRRGKEVIEAVVKFSNYRNRKVELNVGLGIAFAQYKNSASYFAIITEVRMDKENKKIQLVKMTGAIDAGQAINIDGLKNQTEGGMIQSASWTMLEQVKYNEQGIESTNWNSYPIMRFQDVPDVEVEVINRPNEKALGAGEAAQGPTSASIANAIFNACGQRLRTLPFTADKVDWERI